LEAAGRQPHVHRVTRPPRVAAACAARCLATAMALPAGRVHWGVTVATSVQKHHANRTSVGVVPPLNAAAHDPHDGKGGLLQSWAGGPRPEWTVPVYLASLEPAQFRVGITFLRRTFFACVLCFGLTICMTA